MQKNKYQKEIVSFLRELETEIAKVYHYDKSLPFVNDNDEHRLIPVKNTNIPTLVCTNEDSILNTSLQSATYMALNNVEESLLFNPKIDNCLKLDIKNILVIPCGKRFDSDTIFATLILYDLKNSKHIFSKKELDSIDEIVQKSTTLFMKKYPKIIRKNLTLECLDQKKYCETQLNKERDFFSAMVHDIRTPMNAVLGFLELLETEVEQQNQKEYIRAAYKSGELITTLINDILDMSKLQAGKIEIDRYIFSPVDLYKDISMLFYYAVKKKGINLITYFDPEIPYTIQSDPYRLKQIINNFISNAIKFTPEGGSIDLEFNYNHEEETLGISVSDTGIGMSKQVLQKIFSPYVQASKSTTKDYGGTGLGLAISQQLTALLGGKISVESKEGEGSCFTLIIPAKPIAGMIATVDKDDFEEIKLILVKDEHAGEEHKQIISILERYAVSLDIENVVVDEEETFKHLKKKRQDTVCIVDSSIINDNNRHNFEKLVKICDHNILFLESSTLLGETSFNDVPIVTRPLSPDKVFDLILNIIEGKDAVQTKLDLSIDSSAKPLEILVVDDNYINLKLMTEVVKKMNHHPVMAKDGLEAVKIYKEKKLDIVFIDQQMPKMNGTDAIKKMRKIKKEKEVAIYGLTGSDDGKSIEAMREAGAKDVLIKPIEVKKLVAIFNQYL